VFISLSLHVQGQHFIEPRKIQNLIVHATSNTCDDCNIWREMY
jgi:hypothetical protein